MFFSSKTFSYQVGRTGTRTQVLGLSVQCSLMTPNNTLLASGPGLILTLDGLV